MAVEAAETGARLVGTESKEATRRDARAGAEVPAAAVEVEDATAKQG